jgi:hypothetical protein
MPGPTASEILQKAIEAQGLPPVKDAAADVPPALYAKVYLEYTSDKGDRISVDVERKYLAQKDGSGLIWTRVVPTSDKSAETIVGFDGKRPWLWSKQAAAANGKGLRWLDEPGSETDLKQLEEDLASTALLTKSFLLRNLPSQLTDLTRLDDVSRDGLTAWVIEGKAEVVQDGQKKPTRLRLYVEQKTAWLYGARVMIEDANPLQICLWKHEKVDGVVIPGKIELYWNDAKEPAQIFRVDKLKLAPALKPEEFAPPGK